MPELILKLGERVIQNYALDKDELRVGRARNNDIIIDNISVSRNHAQIVREADGKFFLTDLNSSNGTLVNGVRVTTAELLHDDQITVGKHTLHFLHPEGAEAPSHAPEVSADGVPVLEVLKGKQQGVFFRLEGEEISLGRSSENAIRIHDWYVSKRHGLLIRSGGTYVLRDLESWRGTTVNGSSTREVELADGDEIMVGTTTLRFRFVPPEELPAGQTPVAEEHYEEPEEEEAGPPSEASDISQQDDEFAPLSDEEMRRLEEEADMHEGTPEEEAESRRAQWEFQQDEEEFLHEQQDPQTAGRRESEEMISLDDIMTGRIEEDAEEQPPPQEEVERVDREEEQALFGGDVPDEDPGLAPAVEEQEDEDMEAEAGDGGSEAQLWQWALTNRSPIIRKYAAQRLKVLTGQEHDWNSEPHGQ